jgi:hypothetical protein
MAGRNLGTVFVELALDDKVYKERLSDVKIGAVATAKGVETAWKALGTSSDAVFNAQAKAARNAYFLIRDSALSTTQDITRAHEAMQAKIASINSKMASDLSSGFKEAATQSESGFSRMAAAIGLGNLGAQAFQATLHGIVNVFKSGFNAVEEFQVSVISLASVMATFSERGKTDMAGAYKEAHQYATQLVEKIEEWDAKTVLTGKQLTSMVETLAMGGQIVDINNKKQEEGIIAIANAIAMVTKGQNVEVQIRQEIRGLLDGEAKATNRLAQIIEQQVGGNLKTVVEQWKQQGTFIENAGKLLAGFGEGANDLEHTWGAVSTTLETISNKILRDAFRPVYEDIVKLARDYTIEVLSGNSQMTAMKNTIEEGVYKAWFLLKQIMEATFNVVSLFAPEIERLIDKEAALFDQVVSVAIGFNVLTQKIKEAKEEYAGLAMLIESTVKIIGLMFTGQWVAAIKESAKGISSAYLQIYKDLGKDSGGKFALSFSEEFKQKMSEYKREAEKAAKDWDAAFGGIGRKATPPKMSTPQQGEEDQKKAIKDAEHMRRALEELNLMMGKTEGELQGKLAAIEKRYADMREKLKGNADALVQLEQWKKDAVAKLYAEEDKDTQKYFEDAVKNYEQGYKELERAIHEGEKIFEGKRKSMGMFTPGEEANMAEWEAIRQMEMEINDGILQTTNSIQEQRNTFGGLVDGFKEGLSEMEARQKDFHQIGKEVWEDFHNTMTDITKTMVDQYIHADADIQKTIDKDKEALDTKYNRDISRLQAMAQARSADARAQLSDADFVKQEKDKLDQQYLEAKTAIVDKEKELEKSKLTFQELIGGQMANLAGEISNKMFTAAIDKIIGIIGALIGEAAGGAAASGSLKGGVVGAMAEMAIFLGAGVATMLGGKAMASSFKAEGGWVATHPMGGWIQDGSGYKDDVFLGMTPGVRHWGMGGEFVVNKDSAAKHAGLLGMINRDRGHDSGGPINDDWEPLADAWVIGTLASAVHGFFKGFIPGAIAEAVAFNISAIGGAFGGKALSEGFGLGHAEGGPIKNVGYGFFDWLNPFDNPVTRAIGLPDPEDYLPDWAPKPGNALDTLDPEYVLEKIKQVVREPYKQVAKDLLTPGVNWSGPIDGIVSSLKLLETLFKDSLGLGEKKHSGGMVGSDERMIIAQTGEGILSRQGMRNLAMLNAGHASGGYLGPNKIPAGWEPGFEMGVNADDALASLLIRQWKAQGLDFFVTMVERQRELNKAADSGLGVWMEAAWKAEDLAQAKSASQDLALKRRKLEIELLEAQGKAEDALAAKRADELAAMDASLRPLQKQIWAEEALTETREAALKAREDALAAISPGLFSTKTDYQRAYWRAFYGVKGFASGGDHPGGLRIVGERGPELEWTGPSRIFNTNQAAGMVGGDAASEIRELRREIGDIGFALAVNTQKTAKVLDRWDGEGMPPGRDDTSVVWG